MPVPHVLRATTGRLPALHTLSDQTRVFAVFLRDGQVTVRPKSSLHLKDGKLPVLSDLLSTSLVWSRKYFRPAGSSLRTVWRYSSKLEVSKGCSRDGRPHVDLACHGRGDQRCTVLLQAVDGGLDLGDQAVDPRRLAVQEG